VALEKFENPQALSERLADILVKGSLYRVLTYDGSPCHAVNIHAVGSGRYGLLPKELKMYCGHPNCEKEQQWRTGDTLHYFSSNGIQRVGYTCRNCGERNIHYFFIWQEKQEGSVFLKVGQYPAPSIEPSPELSKALGAEDAELYKKALINANYNHGLGAIAYLRRVLENKVNLIIDLIAEALRLEQVEVEAKELEKIKGSHRVEEKINFASGILPKNLKPGGHNPLDKLYAVASAGLHGESDGDCLTIFNDARFVFEYLFKNLTVSNEEAREYVKKLSNPLTTKTNPKDESGDVVGVQRRDDSIVRP
jgi:hypothetical protein